MPKYGAPLAPSGFGTGHGVRSTQYAQSPGGTVSSAYTPYREQKSGEVGPGVGEIRGILGSNYDKGGGGPPKSTLDRLRLMRWRRNSRIPLLMGSISTSGGRATGREWVGVGREGRMAFRRILWPSRGSGSPSSSSPRYLAYALEEVATRYEHFENTPNEGDHGAPGYFVSTYIDRRVAAGRRRGQQSQIRGKSRAAKPAKRRRR